MKAEEIALVAALSRSRAGLKVAADKTYLIESRISPLARRRGYDSISALLDDIRDRRDEALIWSLVEAMASGETMFFRDRAPFKQFESEMLPQLAKQRGGAPIRVWSAACATGQEVYSLAMMVEEMAAADAAPRVEFAASDLSKLALERAQTGLYDQFEVQRGLPIRRLAQHFEKEGDNWRVSEAVRQRVRWRRINLIAGLRQIGRFDIVFCRYVLSHMTEDAQRKVMEDLTFVVPEDGYLVLGQHETIAAAAPAFQPVVGRPGLYRRNPAFIAAAAA
jgi:chemotaxis protein methyltransferase CheR